MSGKFSKKHVIAEAMFDAVEGIYVITIRGFKETDTCIDKKNVGKMAVSFASSLYNCSPSEIVLDRVIYS